MGSVFWLMSNSRGTRDGCWSAQAPSSPAIAEQNPHVELQYSNAVGPAANVWLVLG
jgi:hypothetical protein